ncbi:MAG: hypothetical protein IPM54_22920 [Polyangiaceae bacterium]|nr:hypothetical protein [Polyangiaceae bacterium]
MLRLPRTMGQTLVPVVGFVALANMGCATTIAAKYPHLDRRSVCLLVPDIEQDATEWIYDENNNPISNYHPEIVDRVAATARTVFEYDPNADPSSPRYLPAPYDQLQCPARVSWLPSQEPQQSPLPKASLELSVYKPASGGMRVPQPVAKQLASCPSDSAARLGAVSYTMNFNVYVTDDGQAVSAYVKQSTLGDRATEACMVEALRTTLWPVADVATPVTAALGARTFFAQPAPAERLPNWLEESGIRRILPPQGAQPPGEPGGFRNPYYVTIPLGPLSWASESVSQYSSCRVKRRRLGRMS